MGESQTPHPPAGFAGSPGCFNPPDPNISFSFPFLPFVCPSSSSSSFKYSFYVQRFKKEKKVKGFFFFSRFCFVGQLGTLPTDWGTSSLIDITWRVLQPQASAAPCSARPLPSQGKMFPSIVRPPGPTSAGAPTTNRTGRGAIVCSSRRRRCLPERIFVSLLQSASTGRLHHIQQAHSSHDLPTVLSGCLRRNASCFESV